MVWLGLTTDLPRGARLAAPLVSRLVSIDALPSEEGEECARPTPPTGLSLLAGELPLRTMLLQARLAAPTLDASQRQPERMIRDPYAAYSAVAVDPAHDEVVLTDENLFNIWVYDRAVKTSPTKSTEA